MDPKSVEEIISIYGRMTKTELTSAAKKLGIKFSTGTNYCDIMKLIADKFNINSSTEQFPKRKLLGKKDSEKIYSNWNIDSLHFKNIYIFGDRLSSIQFENGVTSIVGENGVGKTCLINTIKFALFNQSPVLRSGIKNKNSDKPLYININLNCDCKKLSIIVEGKTKNGKLEVVRNIISDIPNTPAKKFESQILGDSDFFEDINYFTLESMILRRRISDIIKLIKQTLELDIAEKKLEIIKTEQRSLSASIKNCPEKIDLEKIHHLEKSICNYKNKILTGENTKQNVDNLISTIYEHSILSTEKSEYERRQKTSEKIAELEKSASNIKTTIPEKVLSEIISFTNNFVSDLTHLKLTETFEILDNKNIIELNSISNYQRLLFELAFRSSLIKFCWRTSCKTFIIDEGFNYINSNIIHSHIAKIFSRLKSVFDKIIFITHNSKISELADHIIQISREQKILMCK